VTFTYLLMCCGHSVELSYRQCGGEMWLGCHKDQACFCRQEETTNRPAYDVTIYASLLTHCPRERLRSIVMSTSVCVCLSVCPQGCVQKRAIFTNLLCMLPMAVARSYSGVITIRYVLPVLLMTSCFSIMGHLVVRIPL